MDDVEVTLNEVLARIQCEIDHRAPEIQLGLRIARAIVTQMLPQKPSLKATTLKLGTKVRIVPINS